MVLLTAAKNTIFQKSNSDVNKLLDKDKVEVKAGEKLDIQYAFQVGEHCFVKLQQELGSVGKLGYFFQKDVNVEVEEMRGIWLTNVDSAVLHSQPNIAKGLKKLKNLGFNTIYPVVWQRGFTLYESAIAQSFIGSSITPDTNFQNRDIVAEILVEAKHHNFRVIPWFEYGLMTPPNSPLAQRHQDLLTLDDREEQIRLKSHDNNKPDEQVWLNPCQPKVQKFIVDLIAEFVQKYPQIDGIQLDDHFGFPVELGYDTSTQELYQKENGGLIAPQNHTDEAWVKWASSKVTQLLKQIFDAVKVEQPNCLISISPNPQGFSKKFYLADWKLWEQAGLAEEIVLQVYRSNVLSFVNEIQKQEVIEACQHIPVSIGILAGIKNFPASLHLIKQQIQKTRKQKFAGASFFFYETVLNELNDKSKPPIVSRNLTKPQDLFG
ncbi:glycoside hydrolase family 10 protein [Aliterella atlantica]|uniref:glycoside hydrolase family 10 protein n=1 Tax=Aliterella atlantica TaxID=1827278 RepID=UPI000696EC09|nr:family 10 glycosylhydrolase [Aliterella atlantica]